MVKKKVIFFDADGTIWHPKKTKYKKHPVWLYRDRRIKHHAKHLVMTPSALSTIKKLRQMGIITIILSTYPQPSKKGNMLIKHKVKHFKLEKLFDEVHATRPYPESKGKIMLKILKKRGIPVSKALMVGDSYKWDYQPAVDRKIDALLIESEYEPMKNQVKRTIKKLSDILKYIS